MERTRAEKGRAIQNASLVSADHFSLFPLFLIPHLVPRSLPRLLFFYYYYYSLFWFEPSPTEVRFLGVLSTAEILTRSACGICRWLVHKSAFLFIIVSVVFFLFFFRRLTYVSVPLCSLRFIRQVLLLHHSSHPRWQEKKETVVPSGFRVAVLVRAPQDS